MRSFLASALTAVSIAMSFTVQAELDSELVLRSEIQFQPLNPARGDSSPQAGLLWGDIREDVPSGALIVFADGFSSPPHIHNITYRAVVIEGAVHNDDPDAEDMWMEPGSFWTQPAGESHITAAAEGTRGVAFLETLEGPYLVQPAEEAFDNGERPINMEARNVVWLDSSDVTWLEYPDTLPSATGPQLGLLWGSTLNGQRNGSFLKLPAGSGGRLQGNDTWLRAVLVQGNVTYQVPGDSTEKALTPGSYFGSNTTAELRVACETGEDCIFYVSTEGKYRFSQ